MSRRPGLPAQLKRMHESLGIVGGWLAAIVTGSTDARSAWLLVLLALSAAPLAYVGALRVTDSSQFRTVRRSPT